MIIHVWIELMKYHTAPAAALKALEASARHLSFTRAAGELNVTQSALRHQLNAPGRIVGREII